MICMCGVCGGVCVVYVWYACGVVRACCVGWCVWCVYVVCVLGKILFSSRTKIISNVF